MGIASEIIELVRLIIEMARQGMDPEDIAEHLEEPESVGADLIKRIAEREQLGRDYLGRDRD